MSGIPVVLDACSAFSDEKNGVSKVIHWTAIPCFLSSIPDSMLSNPPEQRPKPFTFFKDRFMIYKNEKIKMRVTLPHQV
jgi:hypothetical protein